ncbi:hypothetical protein LSH36_316g07016 [Paralvinella palmiformis]|uniref:Uncharacterized protein n=1 Tax=Paralvinella palmiformis TaxID=53620 RepID=A0AAD9N2B1_9ANNE|nr:hypothetical protein LSH36_316g07016 [Paralvinella palmiformis]
MKTLLAVVLVVVAVETTYALQCYICQDVDSLIENSICGDTFVKSEHKDLLQTCNETAGEIWCRKQKTGVNKVATKITRSCATQCEDNTGLYVNRVDCCNNEDGCNEAAYLSPVRLLILATSAVCAAIVFA